MVDQNFVQVFNDRVDQLEARAKRVGLTLTSICRETGVSRATPDRWRKQTPKTVQLLAEMEDIVSAKEAEVQHVEIDGIPQKLANGADGTLKEPTGLHVTQ